MEIDELLPLMTLGAIAPYALEAIITRILRGIRTGIGAYAPSWFHLQQGGMHSA
jgi:hypothetical protein